MKKNKIDVSIIVPAYNEEKYINRCLNSLKNQTTDYSFEVILVDNNSIDKTSQIAQTFFKKMNFKIIKESKQGRGTARWRGFKEAQGEIIMSADADSIYPIDWIQKFTSPLKNESTVATTGSCQINDCSSRTNKIFNFLQPNFMHLYKFFFGHYWLSGFSFAIKAKYYKKSGGFNDHIKANEDIDLSFKVSKLGKIKFINYPIIFSGRRFKQGMLKGLLEYVLVFFLYKDKNINLKDIR